MQRALTTHPNDLSESDGGMFNVVIAYEDFKAGKHGKATYDFLVETLGHDCAFTNQMWKFDVLGIGKLREMALRDAQNADIVIVSCRGDTDLPWAVKSWIEGWANFRNQVLALVALFQSDWEESVTTRAIRDYLRSVAKRAGVEFFAQPNDWPGSRVQENSVPVGREFHQRTLNSLAGSVEHDVGVLRWGINE